jgi:hypothetical protein
MNTTNRWIYLIFHFTLAIVVFIQSVLTVFHSLHEPIEGHLGKILPWFAGFEALAAIVFVLPWTLKIGGVILLTIFAVAIVLHGPIQQISLFVYASGVLIVMFRSLKQTDSSTDVDKSWD